MRPDKRGEKTYVAKVPIQYLDIAMHDLERDELIIHLSDPADEEEGGVAAVDDLRVWFSQHQYQHRSFQSLPLQMETKGWKENPQGAPLYSRKLHIRVRRASTSCVTSFTIFAFAFGGIVVNHFARRTLPGFSFHGKGKR